MEFSGVDLNVRAPLPARAIDLRLKLSPEIVCRRHGRAFLPISLQADWEPLDTGLSQMGTQKR
jgi:hypothetical protein